MTPKDEVLLYRILPSSGLCGFCLGDKDLSLICRPLGTQAFEKLCSGGVLYFLLLLHTETSCAAGKFEETPPYLNLGMNSISGVWIGADHQCIVWCNQLILVLASYINLVANSIVGLGDATSAAHPIESYPEKMIQHAQETFQEIQEADMHPGTIADLQKYGPSCPASLPEIVASGNLNQGSNLLSINSSTFTVILNRNLQFRKEGTNTLYLRLVRISRFGFLSSGAW